MFLRNSKLINVVINYTHCSFLEISQSQKCENNNALKHESEFS
jgi:hypothetical protein